MEVGRYSGIPYSERLCNCGEVEDQFHFSSNATGLIRLDKNYFYTAVLYQALLLNAQTITSANSSLVLVIVHAYYLFFQCTTSDNLFCAAINVTTIDNYHYCHVPAYKFCKVLVTSKPTLVEQPLVSMLRSLQ